MIQNTAGIMITIITVSELFSHVHVLSCMSFLLVSLSLRLSFQFDGIDVKRWRKQNEMKMKWNEKKQRYMLEADISVISKKKERKQKTEKNNSYLRLTDNIDIIFSLLRYRLDGLVVKAIHLEESWKILGSNVLRLRRDFFRIDWHTSGSRNVRLAL